jgi:nucleotide-binding universal stress UspA family protein
VYSRILVPLEHSASDASILEHVRPLARMCGSTLVFIHVADGWAARNISQLQLRESDEMRDDRAYLERVAAEMAAEGFRTEAILATGEPGTEIATAATRENCGLIAMATHGHKFFADLWRGSVANEVRHRSLVPVLLVRIKRESRK